MLGLNKIFVVGYCQLSKSSSVAGCLFPFLRVLSLERGLVFNFGSPKVLDPESPIVHHNKRVTNEDFPILWNWREILRCLMVRNGKQRHWIVGLSIGLSYFEKDRTPVLDWTMRVIRVFVNWVSYREDDGVLIWPTKFGDLRSVTKHIIIGPFRHYDIKTGDMKVNFNTLFWRDVFEVFQCRV